MQRLPRPAKPNSLVVLLTIALLLLLLAAYIGVMHGLVEMSRVESSDEASRRDLAYAYFHLAMLAGAAVLGFTAGKWFNGLGVAFATLVVSVMLIEMLATQMVTYELACHGHNDLVRHWQC